MRISPTFEYSKQTKNLDSFVRNKLEKQIKKIIANPCIGKPLRYKHNERVLYIKPFRIVYSYSEKEDILYLLKFEHRKKVYGSQVFGFFIFSGR